MLLLFVLSLATGAAGISLLAVLPRRLGRREGPGSRAPTWLCTGIGQLAGSNLLLILNLAYFYYRLNMAGAAGPQEAVKPLDPMVDLPYHGVSVALKILWVALYVRFTRQLLGRDLPAPLLRASRIGAPAALLLWVAVLVRALVTSNLRPCVWIHQFTEFAVMVAVLASTLTLAFQRPSPSSLDASPLARSLGIRLLAIWVLATVSLFVGMATSILTHESRMAVNALLLLAYNLVFLHFAHRQTRIGALRDVAGAADAGAWERLARERGLSDREMDIARLVALGKRNQEIADALFISLQTVKDHNYRIFRKLEVRNRVELVNLMRRPLID